MGAYLSEPNLNKNSQDDGDEKITYGASSMQGWRLEQEDAHNSIINFDKNTSFFAVYDGHGGHEVAAYCAKYLPNFLKTLEEYERNDLEAALKTLFLKFDEMLLTEEALKELAQIRDPESDSESDSPVLKLDEVKKEKSEEESELESADAATEQKSTKLDSETVDSIVSETAALYDEACMPLEEVLKRYANTEKRVKKALNKNALKESNTAHLSPVITAPGSSASRKSRLRPNEIQTTPKSAAELDKQEEIDITEIKNNGQNESNGELNCELEFDEASNLCELTDSQKDTETTPKKPDGISTENLDKTAKLNVESKTQNTSPTESPEKVTETKHRNKLCQEEIKLSPIRNKSFSSSSLCNDAASTQKDDTISEATETGEINENSTEVTSPLNGGPSIDEENKENDFNSSANVEKSKNLEEDEAIVTTKASRKQLKKDDQTLIAKLIAGVINKKLRSRTRATRSKEADNNSEAVALVDDEEDDEFDHNYEGEEDESDEDETDGSEDSEDSEDYEDDEEDEEDEESDEEEGEENDGEDADDCYPQPGAAPKPGFDSGCTAVVALLRENKLYVANAGDSRCIVCRDGKAIDMSYDHKPEDELERERVEKAGGQVTKDGRINNGLNLSRAIGDHTYKRNKNLPLAEQMITSLPDVLTLDIDHSKDKFMVLACDGIWNFMSSQDVCDYIQERIDANYSKLSQICEELFMHCLAPNSDGDGTGCDNMTCILVTFQPFKKFEIKLNGNGLRNVEVVEDKNSLKRTLENGSVNLLEETNFTKRMKQEDGSSESMAKVKIVNS